MKRALYCEACGNRKKGRTSGLCRSCAGKGRFAREHKKWQASSLSARRIGKDGLLAKARKAVMSSLLTKFFQDRKEASMNEQEGQRLKRCIQEIREAKSARELAIESQELFDYVRELCAYYRALGAKQSH